MNTPIAYRYKDEVYVLDNVFRVGKVNDGNWGVVFSGTNDNVWDQAKYETEEERDAEFEKICGLLGGPKEEPAPTPKVAVPLCDPCGYLHRIYRFPPNDDKLFYCGHSAHEGSRFIGEKLPCPTPEWCPLKKINGEVEK